MVAKKKKNKSAKKTATTKTRKPRQIRVTGGEPATATQKRGALSKLSVKELQAMYTQVVGRESGSTNSSYLVWKIREAQKGRVRVGPARVHESRGPQQVLSVRVDADSVALLDAAWRKHGMSSRNDLVLRALGRELRELGEREAATRFPTAEA